MPKCRRDLWQWGHKAAGDVEFARYAQGKGQPLKGRVELGIHAGLVAARVHPVPADALKMNRVQPVKAKRMARPIDAEALITECGRDSVCAQQRGE